MDRLREILLKLAYRDGGLVDEAELEIREMFGGLEPVSKLDVDWIVLGHAIFPVGSDKAVAYCYEPEIAEAIAAFPELRRVAKAVYGVIIHLGDGRFRDDPVGAGEYLTKVLPDLQVTADLREALKKVRVDVSG